MTRPEESNSHAVGVDAGPAGHRSAVASSATASTSVSPTPAPGHDTAASPAPPRASEGNEGANEGADPETVRDAEVARAALPPAPDHDADPPPAPPSAAVGTLDRDAVPDAEVGCAGSPPGTACGVPVAKLVVEGGAHDEDGPERVDGNWRVPPREMTHLRYLGEVAVATMDQDLSQEEEGDAESGEESTNASSFRTSEPVAEPRSASRIARHITCGVLLVAIGVATGAGIVLGLQRMEEQGDSTAALPVMLLTVPLSAQQSFLLEVLDPVLQGIGSDAYEVYGTPGGPQHQALKWLENTSFGVDGHFNLTPALGLVIPAIIPGGEAWDEITAAGPLLDTEQQDRVVQRYALAVLYYSTTQGDEQGAVRWTDDAHFLSHKHECDWSNKTSNLGVTCDTDRRVININLEGNRLSGTLPPDLGLLPHLQTLLLAHNRLRGTLPASYGQLTRLRQLILDHNRLSGSIPPEVGRMTSLSHIQLHGNAFIGGMDHFCVLNTATHALTSFDADCYCASYPMVVAEVACRCCQFCCAVDGDGQEECHPNVPCDAPPQDGSCAQRSWCRR